MRNKYIHEIFYKDLNFLDGYESFCYQNCQRLLLESQGLKYPELYINTALSFSYNIKNDDIYSVYGSRSLLPSLETNVKRLYFDDKLDMVTEVFMQNLEYIDKNELPIIVGVDTFFLEYAINYQKNHAIHTLIMCGYDLDKSEIYVIDWYKPWLFKGTVKLEDFLKARNSLNPFDGTMFSGEPIRNNWAFIDSLTPLSADQLFKELIKISIHNYYEKDENDYIFKGIEALRSVKDRLLSSEDINLFKDFYFKLLKISKRYKLFKESLLSYRNLSQNNKEIELLEETLKTLQDSINFWDILLMVILKGSMKLSDKTKERLINNFNSLIENEEKLKTNLYDLNKGAA